MSARLYDPDRYKPGEPHFQVNYQAGLGAPPYHVTVWTPWGRVESVGSTPELAWVSAVTEAMALARGYRDRLLDVTIDAEDHLHKTLSDLGGDPGTGNRSRTGRRKVREELP